MKNGKLLFLELPYRVGKTSEISGIGYVLSYCMCCMTA